MFSQNYLCVLDTQNPSIMLTHTNAFNNGTSPK